MDAKLDPSPILQIGMGFMASRTLLSAVELGLFTALGEQPRTRRELEVALELHERASGDFLDSLVALGMLARDGQGEQARYSNTEQTAAFLDRASPHYLGGILEMASVRLYPFWADLTEALKTGKPQNELKRTESKDGLFQALYSDPYRLERFLSAMAGIQMGNFAALAEKFDFGRYATLCDVGGASAALSIAVARRHPSIRCISFDLPPVGPIARKAVQEAGLTDRITVHDGDFFKDPIPKAAVVTMGNILHDWGLEAKKKLVRGAYEALPEGGCLIAIENVIDDERRRNAFGLLMSLNMLIETQEGFDYTGAQFRSWCLEAGFRSTELMPLTGPASAAVAYK